MGVMVCGAIGGVCGGAIGGDGVWGNKGFRWWRIRVVGGGVIGGIGGGALVVYVVGVIEGVMVMAMEVKGVCA